MPHKESRDPRDWFRIGAKELRRAETLLNALDFSGAGFNIHQALEKYLKGYLLSNGWKLRRIHDLVILLNEAMTYEPSFRSFVIACQKITQYYVEERYPFLAESELSEEEIKESLEIAKKLIETIGSLFRTDEGA